MPLSAGSVYLFYPCPLMCGACRYIESQGDAGCCILFVPSSSTKRYSALDITLAGTIMRPCSKSVVYFPFGLGIAGMWNAGELVTSQFTTRGYYAYESVTTPFCCTWTVVTAEAKIW